MGLFSSNKLTEQGQKNFDIGNIYLERNDFENALKYFNKALESDPKSQAIAEAINNLKNKIKSQRKEIDTSKTMILYTTKNLNTDIVNWYFENNYVVFSIGYGQNTWAICFLKNFSSIQQRIFLSRQIPSELIEQSWNDGYSISHACYGQNLWVVITQTIDGAGGQQWFYDSDFPTDKILSLYQQGYQISICEYGDAWFIVLDENSKYEGQSINFYEDYPNEEFANIWNEDRYINRLFYTGEEWLIIHSKCRKWSWQGLINKSTFPFAELEKEFDENNAIPTSIAHDGDDWNIIYTSMTEEEESDDVEIDEDDLKNLTVEQALQELNELVGLKVVKEEVNNLISLINLNRIKQQRGLNITPVGMHMVFTGNPGTGKTTVARILGKIFRTIGIIKKGHVVEVDRSNLVAEYIGQTAIKTNKVIDEALDGVLFIDEAYSLAKGENDFGQEAIETLLKRMEDDRERLIVIIAGYTDEIKNFIRSNPGLKSRFNTFLHFDDYSAEELEIIFRKSLIKSELQLSSDADEFAKKYFAFLAKSKDKYFGNARDIRNLIEDLIKIQSARLAKEEEELSDEQLRTIVKADFKLAVKDKYEEEHEFTIEEVLSELNNLIGLDEIKQEVAALTDYIKIEQLRKQKGLTTKSISLHSVFYGPPGTGKTTVARLLGKIFKTLGLLSRGQVVEVSRSDLVAEFVGQTAIKTDKVIDDALNGILFIDEAYTLSEGGENDFGKEAIDTILKRMEDEREKLCVIIAGYTEKISNFIDSNPGLKSRFTNYFHFKNYTARELVQIIKSFFTTEKFELEIGTEDILKKVFEDWIIASDENFGNAREARNLFEKIKLQQSKRLSKLHNPSIEDLVLIKKEDIENILM